MLYQKTEITVDYQAMGCVAPAKPAMLTSYLLDTASISATPWKTRPAVIVCPGGGYTHHSPREGEPIALQYNAAGFHAFVLEYSVAPTAWPAQCCELSKAVAYVRSIAEDYAIDKNKIIVCGFSAGAHVAASLGVHYHQEVVKTFSGVSGEENKPDGMILGYPVITDTDGCAHQGSRNNFIAEREEVSPFFSLDQHVNAQTPKTFLWHTFQDSTVPVANSMHFANALLKNKVPYELHIFPEGEHGFALGTLATAASEEGVLPSIQPWLAMSITWLNNLK